MTLRYSIPGGGACQPPGQHDRYVGFGQCLQTAIDLRIENEPCRPEQACAVPALMPIRAGTAQACSGLRPRHTTQWLIFNAKINKIHH
jgi:hypothetical protein